MIVGVTDHYRAPYDVESEALGADVEFVDFNSRDESDFDDDLLRKLDVLLVYHARISRTTIEKLDNCKIVVRYGVGVDNISLDALREKGIPLCNNPAYGIEEIAATAAAHILNLWRRISAYDLASRGYESGWGENIIRPIGRISEGTLGVVGTGRIGAELIRVMSPFGCRILGFDEYQPETRAGEIGYTRMETLPELLAESDAVSLHCVLTEETMGMVDEDFIAAMKPGAILVNTARGGLFRNLDVLEQGLRSGHLGGARHGCLARRTAGRPPAHPGLARFRAVAGRAARGHAAHGLLL